VPGPLFTFGAYLGAVATPSPHGVGGAALGLISIFLPGVLILYGALPFWGALRQRTGARAMMRGVNAAVVGLIAAALYGLVATGSVGNMTDAGIALAGFVVLTVWRFPALLVVLLTVLGSVVLQGA
jgi:chromate transporter